MPEVCVVDKEFEGSRCNIDKRILFVWLSPIVLAILGLCVLLLFLQATLGSSGFLGDFVDTFFAMFLISVIIGLPSFIWFWLRYRSITYTVTRDEVVINEGILNKKRTVLPFTQIQNMYVRRPIVYRLLGIAYIEFETAGSMHGVPEGIIPGIANADELVKDLLHHVKTRRNPQRPAKGHDQELLKGILRELKALRHQNVNIEEKLPAASNLEKEISRVLEYEEREAQAKKKPKPWIDDSVQ